MALGEAVEAEGSEVQDEAPCGGSLLSPSTGKAGTEEGGSRNLRPA